MSGTSTIPNLSELRSEALRTATRDIRSEPLKIARTSRGVLCWLKQSDDGSTASWIGVEISGAFFDGDGRSLRLMWEQMEKLGVNIDSVRDHNLLEDGVLAKDFFGSLKTLPVRTEWFDPFGKKTVVTPGESHVYGAFGMWRQD